MPVRIHALSLISAALAFAFPMAGQAVVSSPVPEAWMAVDGMLRSGTAGISITQNVGSLSLAKSGEASRGGSGVDNYAQFLSQDGAVQATLYIYLPSYADASLAAYMTDKAIMDRFGAKTRLSAYEAVDVAGQNNGAIRAVYDDAADGALTTAAAFVHAGRWLAKIRITGPTERRDEVLAGIDAMLSSLRFDDVASIHSSRIANYPACGQGGHIPQQGSERFCVRNRIETADGSYEMLQAQGVKDGSVIVPVDDMGTVLAFDRSTGDRGFRLSIHSIGQTDIYGVYDRLPGAKQIAAILDGKDPRIAQASRAMNHAANGDVTVRQPRAKAR